MAIYLVKCAPCDGNPDGVVRIEEEQYDPTCHEVVGIEGRGPIHIPVAQDPSELSPEGDPGAADPNAVGETGTEETNAPSPKASKKKK